MSSFNDLPWHDAVLAGIHIDRSTPGVADRVTLSINWPDGQSSELVFDDCFLFASELNFGVIAEETIQDACAVDDCPELRNLRSKWQKVGQRLENVTCFSITTNSTNSRIVICAQSCTAVPKVL